MVADRVEPFEPEILEPAQSWVAGLALEHAGLSAQQHHLLAVPLGDVPQPAPGGLLEAQIVILVHQVVPNRPFVRLGQPHGHVAQVPDWQGAQRFSGKMADPPLFPTSDEKGQPELLI